MDDGLLGHRRMMLVDSEPTTAVRPAAAGSPTFEDVYDEHFAFVWRAARRLGAPAAAIDDVVQEIFLVVHRRLPAFEGRSSLKTWLFAIVLRVVRGHRRAVRRKSPHHAESEPIDPDTLSDRANPGPHEAAARAEGLKLLHELLDSLEGEKREVFVLAELEQLAAPDIAEVTGTNVNTVYTRLRAARQDFNAALSRHRLRDEWRLR